MEKRQAERRLDQVQDQLQAARDHMRKEGWWNEKSPLTAREISDLMYEKECLQALLRK